MEGRGRKTNIEKKIRKGESLQMPSLPPSLSAAALPKHQNGDSANQYVFRETAYCMGHERVCLKLEEKERFLPVLLEGTASEKIRDGISGLLGSLNK